MALERRPPMCEREFKQSSETILAFLRQLHEIGDCRNATNLVNKNNNRKKKGGTSRLNRPGDLIYVTLPNEDLVFISVLLYTTINIQRAVP